MAAGGLSRPGSVKAGTTPGSAHGMMMMATPAPGGGLGGGIGAAKVVQAHHRDPDQGWKLNPGGGRDVKGGNGHTQGIRAPGPPGDESPGYESTEKPAEAGSWVREPGSPGFSVAA